MYGAGTCGVNGEGLCNYIYQETIYHHTYVFENPTVDTPGCDVISNTIIEVNMDGSVLSEAASFNPPYEALCTQPCTDIRFSLASARTVTFKVVSTITGAATLTSNQITITFASLDDCAGHETLTANSLERFYVF